MRGVVAIFERAEDVRRALLALEQHQLTEIELWLPVPDEELMALARPTPSPVRYTALAGGVLGGLAGLGLTIGTTLEWPQLVVGGKPLVSLPPFLVIVFELTILGAALGVVAGFLIWGAWRQRRSTPFDPRVLESHFGVWVSCDASALELVKRTLQHCGAMECRVV